MNQRIVNLIVGGVLLTVAMAIIGASIGVGVRVYQWTVGENCVCTKPL